MDKRQETLSEVHSSIEGIDKEITMILQNLQWDRKYLLEGISLVSCKYDPHHKVPLDKKTAHEEKCFLRSQGYSKNDKMLPDSSDDTSQTVKLSREDILEIINKAAQADPSFKRGPGPPPHAPLTAERLQASYTADERRAIHDAVVSAAPEVSYVDDLALPSTSNEDKKRPKTKLEVLAELRDMRRRRTKYRGASGGSSKYSDVLRDVIKTQMELFTGVKEEPEESTSKPANNTREHFEHKHYHDKNNRRDDRRGKYRDEHKIKEYEETSKLRDNRHYDSYKEKYHSREGKEKKKERYDDDYINYSDNEKHIKKERDEYDTKEYYKEGNGRTSHKSRQKRYEDMYRRQPRDASESRSERSYKKDNYYESSSSRNVRRYKEEYKDTRSTKRHPDEIDRDRHSHDDIKHSKHHDSKYRDEYSYDKKRKRRS